MSISLWVAAIGQELTFKLIGFICVIKDRNLRTDDLNFILIRCGLLLVAYLLSSPSQAANDYDSSLRSLTGAFSSISTGAGIYVNPNQCRFINKVEVPPPHMIMSYTCLVPELSRPQLRSEFLAQGWEPEKILDGAMSKFRKLNQVATLYCDFKATNCKLCFEYSRGNH